MKDSSQRNRPIWFLDAAQSVRIECFASNPGESLPGTIREDILQFGHIVRTNLNDHSLQVKASFITDEDSDFIRVLFIRS